MQHISLAINKLIVNSFVFLCFLAWPQVVQAKQPLNVQNQITIQQEDSVENSEAENAVVDLTQKAGVENQPLNSADTFPQKNTIDSAGKKKQHNHSIINVFISDKKIELLKNKLTEYGEKHLPRKIRTVYLDIVEKVFDYSLLLFLAALILIFIANIAFVLLTLNFTIKRKNQKEKFGRIYGKMYEDVIMAYIFGNIDWEKALIKLKRIKNKANRRILISVLMNFKANFKGELEKFIPEIYVKLNLQNDSLKLARSRHSHKKVMGIMELTHLYPQGAKGMISTLINHSNDYVRTEAQIAYVTLNAENPFSFFEKLKQPFAKWAQLSVFYLIRLNQIPVPAFARFLSFKHYNIRNFSLKMITFFQQFEDVSEVIKMVDNEMEETRFLAYKAINDLRLYDSRELLKKKFEGETNRNKLEILKAFKNIGDTDDFAFLEEVMKTGSISLKLEACRSVYYMGQESRDKISKHTKEEIPELELLLAHVKDPRN
ncbi:hypothetical protein SAMN05444285_10768 [Draconibacterium orientale]|uniref:HEAT repeat-containing protein n=1 Tax=Draconibacterium orientale TaxID=1168034 RepID=X5E344_9BACT|nr:hypothetical protein [Draconibacterium orientale]AHW61860.1 hypothetical protein FH5T_09835 [Draconibacterium orientale]SET17279.1 hypothetical protein SAMN05444285_10768 [Draconibacterium orientale]